MRRPAATVVCVLAILIHTTAHAEGLNNLYAAVNGLTTAPFDPVASALDPPEDFDGLPASTVTAPVMGFMAGTVMLGYRLGMGALDLVFFPFWVFPTLSPEPRYAVIDDVEYDE